MNFYHLVRLKLKPKNVHSIRRAFYRASVPSYDWVFSNFFLKPANHRNISIILSMAYRQYLEFGLKVKMYNIWNTFRFKLKQLNRAEIKKMENKLQKKTYLYSHNSYKSVLLWLWLCYRHDLKALREVDAISLVVDRLTPEPKKNRK